MIQALLWRVRHLCRGLPWPVPIAIGVVAITALMYRQQFLPLVAARYALTGVVMSVRGRVAETGGRPSESTPADKIAAFYTFFPPDDTASDVLDRIFAAAASENLALPQGEYQWVHEASSPLVRYAIVLPVKGAYPGVRRFMAQVLRENPSLALDSVSFGRPTVADIGIDAELRFTLYMRGALP